MKNLLPIALVGALGLTLTHLNHLLRANHRKNQKEKLYKQALQIYLLAESSQPVSEIDGERAIDMFRQTISMGDGNSQGHTMAEFYLAKCYMLGRFVPKDSKKAIEYFTKGALHGNAEAQYELVLCYAAGFRTRKKDMENSLEWLTKSVSLRNARAQCRLGIMYLCGLGVEADVGYGVELLIKSAEQGNQVAQLYMAICCFSGLGVSASRHRAKDWLKLSGFGKLFTMSWLAQVEHNSKVLLELEPSYPDMTALVSKVFQQTWNIAGERRTWNDFDTTQSTTTSTRSQSTVSTPSIAPSMQNVSVADEMNVGSAFLHSTSAQIRAQTEAEGERVVEQTTLMDVSKLVPGLQPAEPVSILVTSDVTDNEEDCEGHAIEKQWSLSSDDRNEEENELQQQGEEKQPPVMEVSIPARQRSMNDNDIADDEDCEGHAMERDWSLSSHGSIGEGEDTSEEDIIDNEQRRKGITLSNAILSDMIVKESRTMLLGDVSVQGQASLPVPPTDNDRGVVEFECCAMARTSACIHKKEKGAVARSADRLKISINGIFAGLHYTSMIC